MGRDRAGPGQTSAASAAGPGPRRRVPCRHRDELRVVRHLRRDDPVPPGGPGDRRLYFDLRTSRRPGRHRPGAAPRRADPAGRTRRRDGADLRAAPVGHPGRFQGLRTGADPGRCRGAADGLQPAADVLRPAAAGEAPAGDDAAADARPGDPHDRLHPAAVRTADPRRHRDRPARLLVGVGPAGGARPGRRRRDAGRGTARDRGAVGTGRLPFERTGFRMEPALPAAGRPRGLHRRGGVRRWRR